MGSFLSLYLSLSLSLSLSEGRRWREKRKRRKRETKGERKASTRSGTQKVDGKEAEELAGGQRDAWGGRRGVQKLMVKDERREIILSPSLPPFAHRHRGLTRVSPVSHPVFTVLLPLSGERVAKRGRRTVGVRERAMPRMTQVPQSLTRLRLFCHLLLSFELFYRLPR